jgi:hypothetical protein
MLDKVEDNEGDMNMQQSTINTRTTTLTREDITTRTREMDKC